MALLLGQLFKHWVVPRVLLLLWLLPLHHRSQIILIISCCYLMFRMKAWVLKGFSQCSCFTLGFHLTLCDWTSEDAHSTLFSFFQQESFVGGLRVLCFNFRTVSLCLAFRGGSSQSTMTAKFSLVSVASVLWDCPLPLSQWQKLSNSIGTGSGTEVCVLPLTSGWRLFFILQFHNSVVSQCPDSFADLFSVMHRFCCIDRRVCLGEDRGFFSFHRSSQSLPHTPCVQTSLREAIWSPTLPLIFPMST